MIIVNLMGGLGNQMFQYAAAKHLSLINHTDLRIDGSNFSKLTANKEHTLQLAHFNISAPQASGSDIRHLLWPHNPVLRFMNFLPGSSPLKRGSEQLYREPAGSTFKPGFLELGCDKYLVGYFNSYKYFDPIRAVLAGEYTPRDEVSHGGRELLRQIEATNSVSIHIRRGDYVADPEIYKCIDGIITECYYRNAVDYIASMIERPHFFIFSNDMAWVKENFSVPYGVTYVDINPPQRGFEDIWIMSRCKHNITAGGSTFSWWAAYLNPNPGKIIVRTENISNEPEYNHPEDYFPAEWASVES